MWLVVLLFSLVDLFMGFVGSWLCGLVVSLECLKSGLFEWFVGGCDEWMLDWLLGLMLDCVFG